jgi:ribosome-binding protein aMBF1 (putative translation factor)
MNLESYVRVYQVWSLLSNKQKLDELPMSNAMAYQSTPTYPDLRHKAQMARVERGLSIQDLSSKIGCTPETLAAFERGDEVLSTDLLQALRSALRLDDMSRSGHPSRTKI